MRLAVIGSGTMGNGIAHVFAQYGHQVALVDTSPEALEKALQTIKKNLDRQLKKGSINEAQRAITLNNIIPLTDLHRSVQDVEMVVEAATENKEVKVRLFEELDKLCSADVILATNTSSISITELALATNRPDKVIGMHFMNPVPLMKLVEVIRGKQTSDEVTNLVMETAIQLDKTPVEVNDAPGFVANRILMPMINEAIYALYEGVSGVTEIDTVMKLGMAHPMGPLRLADYIGLDVCLAILNVMQDGFQNKRYQPCPLLVDMVNQGNKGVKSGTGFYDYSVQGNGPVVARRFNRKS
jgi:3-hydroxybutyryl-CoA dehydrogenase